MKISEKAAYLKGLMDGLKLDTEKAEGKLIASIIDLLGDITESIDELNEFADSIDTELDEIYEDIDELEEQINDYDCCCDDDCDCDDEDDEDDTIFQVQCPTCDEVIEVDEDILDVGFTICPNCGEKLEFEFEEEDE